MNRKLGLTVILTVFLAGCFGAIYVSRNPSEIALSGPNNLLTIQGEASRVIPETRVNIFTSENQEYPSISQLNDTALVIAWESFTQDGDNYGVYARIFSNKGTNLTSEFRVNSYKTDVQQDPSVSRLTDTSFVVAWESNLQDGDYYGIYAKVFSNTGANLTNEFRVNGYTTSFQINPCVCRLTDSSFVVVWDSSGPDGSGYGVFARVFNNSGVNLTNDFQVNTFTSSSQMLSSAIRLTDTTFVVAWASLNQEDGWGVYAKVFSSTGTNLTNEFHVNTYTTSDQLNPSAGRLTDTTFVVTWQSYQQDGSGNGIYAKVFSSLGANLTNEFRVNTYITADQMAPSVSQLTSTIFMVAWASNGQDGYNDGVYARVFSNTGANLTNEFRVNNNTTNHQNYPSTCRLNATSFAIAWQSYGQDGFNYGVYFSIFNFIEETGGTGQPIPGFELLYLFGGFALFIPFFIHSQKRRTLTT